MPAVAGSLVIEIATNIAKMTQGFEQALTSLKGFERAAKQTATAIAGYFSATEMKDLYDLGVKTRAVEQSFAQATRAIGADAEDMVKRLKRATSGMMDETDLMQKATKALAVGLSPTQMEGIGKMARLISKRDVTDMREAYDTITDSIVAGRARALTQMGLLTKDIASLADEATKLGIEGFSLYEMALASAEMQMAKFDMATTNAWENQQRWKAHIHELKEAIGKGLYDALMTAVWGFSKFAEMGLMAFKTIEDAWNNTLGRLTVKGDFFKTQLEEQKKISEQYWALATGQSPTNKAIAPAWEAEADEKNRKLQKMYDDLKAKVDAAKEAAKNANLEFRQWGSGIEESMVEGEKHIQAWLDKEKTYMLKLRDEVLARAKAGADAQAQLEENLTNAFGTELEQRTLYWQKFLDDQLVLLQAQVNAKLLTEEEYQKKRLEITARTEEQINILRARQSAPGKSTSFIEALISGGSSLISNLGTGLMSGLAPQSFITKLLGGTGSTGGNIGGALGGILGGAGMTALVPALGSAFLGSAIAAPITALLGSQVVGMIFNTVLPGLGVIIGGLLGSTIGKLFSGSPQDKRKKFAVGFGGTAQDLKYGGAYTAPSGWWFSQGGEGTELDAMQMTKTFEAMQKSLRRFSEELGTSFENLDKEWKYGSEVLTDSEQIIKALGAYASWVTGIDFNKFVRNGENLQDTIAGVINAITQMDDLLKSIDVTIAALNDDMAAFRYSVEVADKNIQTLRDALADATDPRDILTYGTQLQQAIVSRYQLEIQMVQTLTEGIRTAEVAAAQFYVSMAQRMAQYGGPSATGAILNTGLLYYSRMQGASSSAEKMFWLEQLIGAADQYFASMQNVTGASDSAATSIGRMASSANEWSSVFSRAKTMLTSLTTTSANPANAVTRALIAGSGFQSALGGYMTNRTPQGAASVMDAISTYLSAAQEAYQRPSREYQAIWEQVTSVLEMISSDANAYQRSIQTATLTTAKNTTTMVSQNADAVAFYKWAQGEGLKLQEDNLNMMRAKLVSMVGSQTADQYIADRQSAMVIELTKLRLDIEASMQKAGVPIPGAQVTETVPAMASGGYVKRSGLAYIHEGETVVPKGGVNVSITVNGSGDPKATARAVEDALIHSLKYGRGRRAVREVVNA